MSADSRGRERPPRPAHGAGRREGEGAWRAEEVLAAATRLFRERGYESASVREIAAALGIRSSSLYYHFPNKQAILFEACRRIIAGFNAEMLPLLATDEPPEERLRKAIRFSVSFQARRQTEVLVTTRELRSLSPEQREVLANERRIYRTALTSLLREAATEGSLDVPDPALAARVMIDVISAIPQWYHPDGPTTIDEIARWYEHVLLSGFGAADARRPRESSGAAARGRSAARGSRPGPRARHAPSNRRRSGAPAPGRSEDT